MRLLITLTALFGGLLGGPAVPAYAQTDSTVATEKTVVARIGKTVYTIADIRLLMAA